MASADFVHLHLHSHYSILDGLCQFDPLLDRAKELGFRSLALTDHGNMFGAIDFYTMTLKAGMKPIMGMEAYIAPGSRLDKAAHGMKDASFHLTLLAESETGYHNLIKLSSLAYIDGFYYRPRIDKEILDQHKEGVICLSGCLSGEVSRKLLNGKEEDALTSASEYFDIFGKDHFYLEVQDNGLQEQQQIIPGMKRISEKLGIPLVASSDVHYIMPEDAKAQDVLICINTGKLLSDNNRMKMSTDEFYLKSAEQMRLLFKDLPGACDRTLDIAERCNVKMEFGDFHLPTIEAPDGSDEVAFMEKQVWEGIDRRYETVTDEIRDRVNHELKVIKDMGFPSYFLMVADIVNFAKDAGIPVGPGRGSAAGSIVAYAMRITDLDPLKYDLLFERFLNEGRNEMPDVDLDFCKERRGEVVDYIIERFGREECAQIITFGKLSAKSAVRDVGRVLDLPLNEVDMVAKLIPDMLKPKGGKTTIEIAMEQVPDLQEIYDKDPAIREMIDIAKTLDMVIRQTGTHAAGVLVADKPIVEYCPLARRGEDIFTQFEMKKLEKMGLCKVDVLGLETLTIIKHAVHNLKLSQGIELDIATIDLADTGVYEMVSRGETKGVFQLESSGFRDLLTKLRPDRFEDIIAAVAMYRPGPLGAGLVDTYIDCKHGRKDPEYLHPMLEPILNETFGLILYQEQVQALALQVAHFSLSEGDLMRRAMGKKMIEIMNEYREKFMVQAADTTGSDIAGEIFDQIEYFAGYGFNKSHSACYALIAYQTAFLKHHYPREFMAAQMTAAMGDNAKLVDYIGECGRIGFTVLGPDINASRAEFTVVGDDLRFGLGAIKGVGVKALEEMVQEREENGPFKDLYDFCERVDLKALNKGSVIALIKGGAFDCFEGHRAMFMAGLEGALAAGSVAAKAKARNQTSLFAAMGGEDEVRVAVDLPDVAPWPEPELLALEKEVIGFYVSSHPLASHAKVLRTYATSATSDLKGQPEGASVVYGGMICSVRLMNTKKGDRYARVILEDLEGSVNAVVWPKTYNQFRELLLEDQLVFVKAKVDRRREDEPELVIDEVILLERALEELCGEVQIHLKCAGLNEGDLNSVGELIKAHKGDVPIYFDVKTHDGSSVYLRAGRQFGVQPSTILRKDIDSLLGEGHVLFAAAPLGRD
ncbi:MAG: DNA polymerase III subunit alpha [Planctomycetota bacterium]|jgi:DNA polymerase-3 subunit alpha